MFGFMEKSYLVLDDFLLNLEKEDGFKYSLKVEVRIPDSERDIVNGKVNEYIALEGYSENNKLFLDLLLIYKNNSIQDMYDDFEKLKKAKYVDLVNLKCFDWISGHHIGFSRDGARRMY